MRKSLAGMATAFLILPIAGSADYSHPAETSLADRGGRALRHVVALASRDARWVVYSSQVNSLTCAASADGVTWLGTELGLKRVDVKSNTVLHFGAPEGLPGNRVEAIVADGDGVWCAVRVGSEEPGEGRRSASQRLAVCRLNAKEQRWQTLRELPRAPDPFPGGQGEVRNLHQALLAVSERYAAALASPVAREQATVLHLFDRQSKEWLDVPWDPNIRAGHNFLSVSSLWFRGGSLWLGTNLGLLRYRLRERRWERLLPRRYVYGAVPARDAFWLICYDFEFERGLDDRPRSPWEVTRVNEEGAEPVDFPLVASGQGGRRTVPYAGIPIGLDLEGESLWVTWSGDRSSPEPGPVCRRLDLKAKEWSEPASVTEKRGLEVLPESVYHHAPPGGELLAARAPWRFPRWFCKEESPAIELRAAAGESPSAVLVPDGKWRLHENALYRTLPDGKEERMVPPPAPIGASPDAAFVSVAGTSLIVGTDSALHRFDPAKGSWQRIKVPDSAVSSGHRAPVAAGKDLWIASASGYLRYDETTGGFTLVGNRGISGMELLLVTETDLWLRDQGNRLFRQPLTEEKASEIKPEAPANVRLTRPIVGAGGWIWYTARLEEGDGFGSLVLGWSPKTQTCTAPLRTQNSFNDPAVLPTAGGAFVSLGEDLTAAVRRFDGARKKWVVVTPPLPRERDQRVRLDVLAVDAEAAWTFDREELTLHRYDRIASAWESFRCPEEEEGLSERRAVLLGKAVFVATGKSLWRFDLATKRWERQTMPNSRRIYLRNAVITDADVWALAGDTSEQRTFGAYLDLATRKWRFWGPAEGFPDKAIDLRLVSVGDETWAFSSRTIHRFDKSTERWEDLTRQVLPDGARVNVAALQADGDGAWALLRREGPPSTTSVAPPLLVRLQDGGKEVIPHPFRDSAAASGLAMLVGRAAIWVAATTGLYRFDKTAGTWTSLAPPLLPRLQGTGSLPRITRSGGRIWFWNGETYLGVLQAD